MKKTSNLLKCLKSYNNLLKDLDIPGKSFQELELLINTLESQENIEFNKIIKAIQGIDKSVETSKTKVNIDHIASLYKALINGVVLSDQEYEIIKNFEKKNQVNQYLLMDSEKLKELIYKNSIEIKTINGLKLILNYKFNIDIKGQKSRKGILSEAIYLINQNQYYQNIEKAYKSIDEN